MVLDSQPKSPPRLVVVQHESRDDIQGYISADGISLECSGKTILDYLLCLLGCYYAWDLSYPKQYQLLAFLQVHLLLDTGNQVNKSTNFIKFEKQFNEHVMN